MACAVFYEKQQVKNGLAKIPCNAATAALCNRALRAYLLPHPRTSPLRSLRSHSPVGGALPPLGALRPVTGFVLKTIQDRNTPSPLVGEGWERAGRGLGEGDIFVLSRLTQNPGGYQSEHKGGRESAPLISSERGRQRTRYHPRRAKARKKAFIQKPEIASLRSQ